MVDVTINQLDTAVISTEDAEDEKSRPTPSLLFLQKASVGWNKCICKTISQHLPRWWY